jgi:hypothetical protein
MAVPDGMPCTPGKKECSVVSSCVNGMCQAGGNLGDMCGDLSPGETAGCLQGGCVKATGSTTGTCQQYDPGAACVKDECGRGGLCAGTPDGPPDPICHARCAPVTP